MICLVHNPCASACALHLAETSLPLLLLLLRAEVPPGWFYTGTAAVRCPKGEYRGGYAVSTAATKCDSCPVGSTTEHSNSTLLTDCKGEHALAGMWCPFDAMKHDAAGSTAVPKVSPVPADTARIKAAPASMVFCYMLQR